MPPSTPVALQSSAGECSATSNELQAGGGELCCMTGVVVGGALRLQSSSHGLIQCDKE